MENAQFKVKTDGFHGELFHPETDRYPGYADFFVRSATVFLDTFSAAVLIQSCLKFVFLMM